MNESGQYTSQDAAVRCAFLACNLRPELHPKLFGMILEGLSRVARPAAPVAVDDAVAERVETLIEEHLESIERRGFIVPACDTHGRDHIAESEEHGEFCRECAADDGGGELVHLAIDSEAIEMAGKIRAALAKPPSPAAAAPAEAGWTPASVHPSATGLYWGICVTRWQGTVRFTEGQWWIFCDEHDEWHIAAGSDCGSITHYRPRPAPPTASEGGK